MIGGFNRPFLQSALRIAWGPHLGPIHFFPLGRWRKTIFEQAAANLFSDLEVFLRDLLLDNLLDAGWILVKQGGKKLERKPKPLGTGNEELRDELCPRRGSVPFGPVTKHGL